MSTIVINVDDKSSVKLFLDLARKLQIKARVLTDEQKESWALLSMMEERAKAYNANEKDADTKYLNKAIEVSGTISEVDKNQDGGTMVILQTGDPAAGVQCAMRDKGATVAK